MNFDILVVGNGILGLSTAYALSLKEPAAKIGIIGPRNKAGSASTASGAMLGCFGEVTESTFKSEYGLAKLDLAIKSAAIWPKWVNQINACLEESNKLKIQKGTFIILNTNSGPLDEENYRCIIRALEMYSEPHEYVNPRDIPGMKPVENCRPLQSLFLPNEGFVNAQTLISALSNAISTCKNITFVDDVVTKITTSFSKISSVTTISDVTITAKRFLLAAGAYTQTLLEQIPPLQFRIPRILFGTGSSLILKHSEFHNFSHVVRSPNRAGACGAHIVPYDNHTLYMGASNNIRLNERIYPKARDMYYLIERAIEQFNQNLHQAEIIRYQVGNRPVTVDSYPLIGRTPVENLWLLTGTYRDGIHDSPLLAQFIANEMLDQENDIENKFMPARNSIQLGNKEDAIKDFVGQCLSAGYEHSIDLPKIGWDTVFEDGWKQKAESIYSQLGVNNWLSPDILFMLDQEPEAILELKKYFNEANNYYSGFSKSHLESLPKVKISS